MLEKRRHVTILILLLLLFTALVVPEDILAISVPPYIAIFFEPQSPSEKPLNIQAGSTTTFKVMVLNYGGWADGDISLSVILAPSWLNVTLIHSLLTHITKGDFYNSTMTVKIAEDAPEGPALIIIHANATLLENGVSNSVYRLGDQKGVSLNIIAPSVRVTTKTITATSTSTTTVTAEVTQTETTTTTLMSTHTELPRTTTTVFTTITKTMTNTSTEQAADASTYAWEASATVATVVLAVVLLLQRRTKYSA